jgi:hypothetical protein
MKRAMRFMAVLALAVGGGLIGIGSPAAATAAGPNGAGTNCHGVVLSYLSTSGMSPGQLHQQYGVSVQSVQASADMLCAL